MCEKSRTFALENKKHNCHYKLNLKVMKKMSVQKIQEVAKKELFVDPVQVEEDCVQFELHSTSSYTLSRCRFPYYTIHPSVDGGIMLLVYTKF